MPGVGRPVVQVNSVSKVYGNGTVALTGVDMALKAGEFVSLLGPSGCGKSTLLRLMAGLGSPSSGRIAWWEQDHSVVGTHGHRLAYVFQDPSLMPWANVERNVYLPLKLASVSRRKADQPVARALEMVGLNDFREAYPRELSGGMQMRVSIARALVTSPNLLFMDEPFGALDEMTRARLNQDLLSLWYANKWTIAFVTHSIYEAVFLSSRVMVMAARPGRVVADITVDAPYPRTDSFRNSAEYHQYCRTLSQCLAKASEPQQGDRYDGKETAAD
ncbi:MAG: ABC transporter ATP-binding protein [Gammaproteobacteria bacterium]